MTQKKIYMASNYKIVLQADLKNFQKLITLWLKIPFFSLPGEYLILGHTYQVLATNLDALKEGKKISSGII